MEASKKMSERQQNEIEYHKEYSKKFEELRENELNYEVILSQKSRWWNAYWDMYSFVKKCHIKGKKVLVVGCGFGKDAFFMAKLGADVYAFDISLEIIEIAKQLNIQENANVHFQAMASENLSYDSDFFDYILANGILHHVEIPQTMSEIVRVSKKEAIFLLNEIYTHSFLDKIRYSKMIKKILYPLMMRFVYQNKIPYITKDERKMSEKDIQEVVKNLDSIFFKKYYYFLARRLFPDKYTFLCKLDKILLSLLRPIAFFLGGSIVLGGTIKK